MPMKIINDTISPSAGPYGLTPHEENVQDAVLVMEIVAPIMASFLIWVFTNKEWTYVSTWTYNRLSMFWFWSVAIFGIFTHFQHGVTTRTTFMIGILHTQIEVLIAGLFLHFNFRQAVIASGVWGLVLYTFTIILPSIDLVWFTVAVFSGALDIFLVLLLAYASKWRYATGALMHALSAVLVLAQSVIPLNTVFYSCASFIALWLHIGFTTISILADAPIASAMGYIQLPSSMMKLKPSTSPNSSGGGLADIAKEIEMRKRANPLRDVKIPQESLWALGLGSVVSSLGVAMLLSYLA
ncbi:hypothetical protein AX16_004452 [Volvariella volvacea WC 439]|nr:hypothetical protein AX16_004452 [Volvariella volvacea WC 439]